MKHSKLFLSLATLCLLVGCSSNPTSNVSSATEEISNNPFVVDFEDSSRSSDSSSISINPELSSKTEETNWTSKINEALTTATNGHLEEIPYVYYGTVTSLETRSYNKTSYLNLTYGIDKDYIDSLVDFAFQVYSKQGFAVRHNKSQSIQATKTLSNGYEVIIDATTNYSKTIKGSDSNVKVNFEIKAVSDTSWTEPTTAQWPEDIQNQIDKIFKNEVNLPYVYIGDDLYCLSKDSYIQINSRDNYFDNASRRYSIISKARTTYLDQGFTLIQGSNDHLVLTKDIGDQYLQVQITESLLEAQLLTLHTYSEEEAYSEEIQTSLDTITENHPFPYVFLGDQPSIEKMDIASHYLCLMNPEPFNGSYYNQAIKDLTNDGFTVNRIWETISLDGIVYNHQFTAEKIFDDNYKLKLEFTDEGSSYPDCFGHAQMKVHLYEVQTSDQVTTMPEEIQNAFSNDHPLPYFYLGCQNPSWIDTTNSSYYSTRFNIIGGEYSDSLLNDIEATLIDNGFTTISDTKDIQGCVDLSTGAGNLQAYKVYDDGCITILKFGKNSYGNLFMNYQECEKASQDSAFWSSHIADKIKDKFGRYENYDIPEIVFPYQSEDKFTYNTNSQVYTDYIKKTSNTYYLDKTMNAFAFNSPTTLDIFTYYNYFYQTMQNYLNAGWTIINDDICSMSITMEKEFPDGDVFQAMLYLDGGGDSPFYLTYNLIQLDSKSTSTATEWSAEIQTCMKDNFNGLTLPYINIGDIQTYESFYMNEICMLGQRFDESIFADVKTTYQENGFTVTEEKDSDGNPYLEIVYSSKTSGKVIIIYLRKSTTGNFLFEAEIITAKDTEIRFNCKSK